MDDDTAPTPAQCQPPAPDHTYATAVESLFSSVHQSQTPEAIRLSSLRRTKTPNDMRRYLSRIALPHDSPSHCRNIVHITGTKGKGSTASMCESILRLRDGLTTGLFTSPHLVDIRERIRINGRPVSKEVFGAAYWEVRRRLELWEDIKAADDGGDELPVLPGYFRMLVLVATFIFAHHQTPDGKKIDALILEVGVGGRYDATNIFDHSPRTNTVCGVTLIDYDHTRVLGSTLGQIAWEKGGIFHADKAGIVDVLDKDVDGCNNAITPHPSTAKGEASSTYSDHLASVQPGANEEGAAKFFTIETNSNEVVSILGQCSQNEGNGQKLHMTHKNQTVPPEYKVGLPGEHQRVNAELAVALCEALLASASRESLNAPAGSTCTLKDALERTFWPGRCQTVALAETEEEGNNRRMNIRCDGAHTPQSLATCLEWYRTVSGFDDDGASSSSRSRILLFNCSHERNPVQLLDMIQSVRGPKVSEETSSGEEPSSERPLFGAVYFCHADSERPSMIPKATPEELLRDAGVTVPQRDEHPQKTNPSTTSWQDTLLCIWKALELQKSSSHRAVCFSNMAVRDALASIKREANSDTVVDICVTGSLYIVGSALNAVRWIEEAASGRLDV